MKPLKLTLATAAIIISLSACNSTTLVKQTAVQPVSAANYTANEAKCFFADQSPGPDWLCESPAREISAVGIEKLSAAGLDFTIDIAAASARAKIAKALRSYVVSNITNAVETTGLADRNTEIVSKSLDRFIQEGSANFVTGAKQRRYRLGSDNNVYVLVEVSSDKNIEESVANTNKAALKHVAKDLQSDTHLVQAFTKEKLSAKAEDVRIKFDDYN